MTNTIQRTTTLAMILGLVVIGSTASRAEAPFWPQFHGPAGDNISTETGLLPQWPAGGPRLLWTAKGMGEGFASVSLANGLIFTAGNVGNETVVIALKLDGSLAWKAPCGKAWTASHAGTRSTPTIDGDRLYYETPLGDLVCLDAASGKKIWGRNILQDFDGKNIQWALSESPLVDGDNLICCPFGSQASVVALDKQTGQVRWAAPATGDSAGYATPALAEFAGRRMILTMSAKELVGVDADRGELLFRHKHETRYDVNALKPVCIDGWVFISSGYGSGSEMVQLSASGNKITARGLWSSKELDNHHGGVVVWDGHIYGADSKRNWLCLDWKSGKTLSSAAGVGKGSLTCAEGMLYTLGENNRQVALVKATPSGHPVVSQFELPAGGEGPAWAHPVVCGGQLYIRHGDLLFAFAIKE